MKRGPEAIDIYVRALDEGKEKIPYCGLLILGKKQVGKTSLYRQLVGKEFEKNLEPTKGIDNNTVDTVDRRSLDIEKEVWQEMESPDTGEQLVDAVLNKVMPELSREPEAAAESEVVVGEDELLRRIRHIVIEMQNERVPAVLHMPSQPLDYFNTQRLVLPTLTTDQSHPQPPPLKRMDTQPPKDNPEEVKRAAALKKPVVVLRKMKNPLAKQIQPDPPPNQIEQVATPPPAEPPAGEHESAGMINRRQSSKIGDVLNGKRAHDKKEPPLVLNTLDFAGEKHYRSMHHCFIRRRAIYVVVFKIPDMLDEKLRCDSIEEVRYWIHSIHAHIYPPDKTMKGEDEKINRVFLVGTHRGEKELSRECFEKLNDLIKVELVHDDYCGNHICPIKSTYFIPVENSLDPKRSGREHYLIDSGTRPLQDEIRAMSKDPKKLPFLHEYQPIKWLNFEGDLKYFSKKISPPVAKIEEVKKIATDSKITTDEMQNLALQFFHDTGKIIYLSEFILMHYNQLRSQNY